MVLFWPGCLVGDLEAPHEGVTLNSGLTTGVCVFSTVTISAAR
jgi:hypothetical protein